MALNANDICIRTAMATTAGLLFTFPHLDIRSGTLSLPRTFSILFTLI